MPRDLDLNSQTGFLLLEVLEEDETADAPDRRDDHLLVDTIMKPLAVDGGNRTWCGWLRRSLQHRLTRQDDNRSGDGLCAAPWHTSCAEDVLFQICGQTAR
jgi:hypothetical protein